MNTTSQRIARSFLGLLGAASVFTVVAPANADSIGIDDVRQTTVKYRDLDLAHPAGRAAFDHRVASAAKSVCTEGNRIQNASELSCRRGVVEQAYRIAGLDRQAVGG